MLRQTRQLYRTFWAQYDSGIQRGLGQQKEEWVVIGYTSAFFFLKEKACLVFLHFTSGLVFTFSSIESYVNRPFSMKTCHVTAGASTNNKTNEFHVAALLSGSWFPACTVRTYWDTLIEQSFVNVISNTWGFLI